MEIRVDDGYREGMEVPIFYDPLLAKLIVHAETRTSAIEAMSDAIDQYEIEGVTTTLPFGHFVMDSQAFRSGQFDTHFIKEHFKPYLADQDSAAYHTAAIVAASLQREQSSKLVTVTNNQNKWKNRRTSEGQ